MDGTPTPETTTPGAGKAHELIGTDRVHGTGVYRPNGERIGYIVRIMIDKRTGQAAYAVMNFGGFLGLGQEAYPLPWSLLTFSAKFGGYVVEVSDEQLRSAPTMVANENLDMGDRGGGGTRIFDYYGVPPYWF